MLIRDGDWILHEYDPAMKRQVWYRENPDGSTTFRTDYEVTDVVDFNTELRNGAARGWAGDWHRIASVPHAILHDPKTGLVDAFRENDDRHISRWLNDGGNRAWRTKEGSV